MVGHYPKGMVGHGPMLISGQKETLGRSFLLLTQLQGRLQGFDVSRRALVPDANGFPCSEPLRGITDSVLEQPSHP